MYRGEGDTRPPIGGHALASTPRAAPPRVTYRVYVLILVAAFAVLAPSGLRAAWDAPVESALWIVLIAAASLVTVPILPRFDLDATLSTPISIATAVVLPPPLAVLVNGLGLTNERELQRSASIWLSLFNRAQIALSTGAASLLALTLRSLWLEAFPNQSLTAELIGTAGAVAAFNFVNVGLVSISLTLRSGLGFSRAAKDSSAPFPRFGIDFLLVGLLAIFIVVAYEQVGPLAVILIALPLGLGYNAMQSAKDSEDRALELAHQVRELEALNVLGEHLLSAANLEQVRSTSERALVAMLETPGIAVALNGQVAGDLRVFKIPGADPAVVGVPASLSEGSSAVVEAVAGLLGVTLQRVELSEELGEMQRARVALSGQILEEGTRERSRIALEIHDEVLPYLAAAEIQADNIRSALFADEGERAGKLALASRDAIHGGISRLREVLDALRNQIIVPGSLLRGLREALDDLKLVHGVEGDLEAPDELPPLPLAVEILVLETVRGCLTNVARHAKAHRVAVSVAVTETLISATVCDDGVGFEPAAVSEDHHGIDLMTRRVQLARGRFVIESNPGQGSLIQIDVPL